MHTRTHTHVHHPLAAAAVHRVRAEVAVQHLPVRMQDQPELAAERRKAHLLDGVERVTAVRRAALDDGVLQIGVRVQHLVVVQVLVQLGWRNVLDDVE